MDVIVRLVFTRLTKATELGSYLHMFCIDKVKGQNDWRQNDFRQNDSIQNDCKCND